MDYNKFQQSYQVDKYGNIDSFCFRLDCFEQPSYFELRKVSQFDPWIFFCDDINMYITKENDRYSIYPYSTGEKKKYQKVDTWEIHDRYFEEIAKKIKEKDAILLDTAFNYIPEYAWWGEGGDDPEYIHTGHYCYIIGAF